MPISQMRWSTLSSGLVNGPARCLLFGLGAAIVGSCAGQTPLVPSDELDPGSPPHTFTIANSGVTPRALLIAVGERVVFVNADEVPHDMSSDQHPTHLECTAINQAGYLRPGESRETGNFVRAETCGFHDHLNASTASLTGRIIVAE